MKMNTRQVALVNTTMGVLMAGLNANVVLIALPAIFRGLNVDPMAPANSSLLLWVLMGYSVVIRCRPAIVVLLQACARPCRIPDRSSP